MSDEDRPALADQRDIEEVYQPAEDSQLLAETVVDATDSSDRVLDVGTGSGYVGITVQSATGASVVGSDRNPKACREATENGLPVVCGDLVDPFAAGQFDVVCFNPPYLPTPPEMEWDDHMEDALSGGEDGREVIEPFLAEVSRVLAPDGRVFVLCSSLTGPEEVLAYAESVGLAGERVAEQSEPFEKLLVFRFRQED